MNVPSIAELALRIRSKQLTISELVTICLDRIDEVDSEIGAWVSVDKDHALNAAQRLQSQWTATAAPPQRPQQVIESIRLKHGRRQLLLTSPEHWLGYDAVGTGQGGMLISPGEVVDVPVPPLDDSQLLSYRIRCEDGLDIGFEVLCLEGGGAVAAELPRGVVAAVGAGARRGARRRRSEGARGARRARQAVGDLSVRGRHARAQDGGRIPRVGTRQTVEHSSVAVSYTHLTLPTILLV